MIDIEHELCAYYLVRQEADPRTSGLRPDHFADKWCRQWWSRALDLGTYSPAELGIGDKDLQRLQDVRMVPLAHQVPEKIRRLQWRWAAREGRQALASAQDALRGARTPEEISDVLSSATGALTQYLTLAPSTRVTHAQEAPRRVEQWIGDLQTDDRVIATPWIKLNERMAGGVPLGKLTMIGGRSSEHKTTLARALLHHAVRDHGLAGTYWTLEDSNGDMAGRTIASEVRDLTLARLSSGRWSSGAKRPTEAEMSSCLSSLKSHLEADWTKRLGYLDRECPTIDEVCATIEREVAQHHARMIVLDFIQLIDPGKEGESTKYWRRACARLAGMAKRLDIAIVATSQVDKVGTKESSEAGRPPMGIDMPYGTALRQQAFAVLMVGVDERSGQLVINVDKYKSAKRNQSIRLDIDAAHDRLGGWPEVA